MSLRTSLAYMGVRIASGALAMASLALIVRGLGPERYGQFTLALAAAALVTQILFNPINSMLARFYGDVSVRDALVALLRTLLRGVGLGLIGVAALAELLGLTPFAGHILLAAACLALAQGEFDFTGQHLAAAQHSRRYSAQFLGKAVLMLVLAWLALRAGGGATWVLLAMTGSFVLAVIVARGLSGWLVWPGAAGWRQWPAVLSFAGPLMLTSALGYLLLWGDRYLLQHLVPLSELGRYSAMADLAQQTLGLIFSGLCTAWYPRIVLAWGGCDYAEAQRLYQRYATLGLAIVLPVGMGFALMVHDVAPLMYGSAYAGISPLLLPLISAAAVIGAMKSYYFDIPLLLAKRVWRHSASIAGSALVSLLLAWLAIPWLGTSGAALGLLLGQGVGMGLSLIAGRGVLVHRVPCALWWPPVVGVALMAACLAGWTAVGWLAVITKIVAGCLVYFIVIIVADFDGIRHRLKSRFA